MLQALLVATPDWQLLGLASLHVKQLHTQRVYAAQVGACFQARLAPRTAGVPLSMLSADTARRPTLTFPVVTAMLSPKARPGLSILFTWSSLAHHP